MHTSSWRHSSVTSTMVEEGGGKEDKDELTCIHWGYLNVLQLHDVSGKKIKHPHWHTFWTDLCGSTLRFYKDTSLPGNNNAFPPATMIGPRPESQVKYAFFSLRNGNLKDYDATENSPKLSRKTKMGRKHVLQVVLANFSVYFLQAPTMSAFYRWRTKLQFGIDHAHASENFYDKQLNDAKMAMYEQQRCYVKPEPTYPEAVKQDTKDEENVCSAPTPTPCDPRVIALREKLLEKRRLLSQLEKQERDFLGTDNGTMTRIEFSATAKNNYFLVIGRPDTLIPEGRTITIFGRLPNGRWRCFMDREDDHRGSCNDSNGHDIHSYPMIGSVPTSVIVELNQPSRIKDFVDSLSISSNEMSPPGTPADDLSTTSTNSFTYDVIIPSSQSPRRLSDAVVSSSQTSRSEPYSNHKYGNTLAPPKGPLSTSEQTLPPTRPTQISPLGHQVLTHRVTRPSDSSMSPTSPQPESVSDAMTDLNRALESLAALTPRSRVSSNVSTCSRTSNSSLEDDSSDMSRGSRIELNSDDEETADSKTKSDIVIRRRLRRRDIHISRKLHAKGISIIVGSSSSSEDEDDCEEIMKGFDTADISTVVEEVTQSRKIEGLQSSKEKLTEKVIKGVAKSSPENTTKLPNGDRSSADKPTTSTDLLREFSDNGCYGEPIRNSVTQAQFKPLASHEIPPPLHQRRTLQMTRKENEGFGFVLQTNTVIQPGAYSDSMTFVSNVSEDGPAYLAGMRPGDVIIEVQNMTVEDEHHQMIIDSLKDAGLTIRLVVVYKNAIQRMRLSTRMLALKARLSEAEKAYDELSKKEKMILDHVKDPSVRDIKVQLAVIHIHIQIASATFARDTPDIKNSVVQTKRTPIELLEAKQSPDGARNCGASTTGYELVREFATTCEPRGEPELEHKATSPKYASDTSLNLAKKQSESNTKQKTLKQCQRSSFVSYVDFDQVELGVTDTPKPSSVTSRRRIKSDGYDPDDLSKLSEEFADKLPPMKNTTLPARVTRPESYMFALGSQNAIDTSYSRDTPPARVNENSVEDGLV